MHNILATTLLAPVAVLPNFVIRPDWSRLLKYLPALVPAAIVAWRGWSFEGAFAFTVLVALIVAPPVRKDRWVIAAAAVLALLIFLDFNEPRPRGHIFKNALTAGQAMALLAVALDWPLLAAAAGFTGSRSPLGIVAVALRPSWRTVFPVICYGIGFLAWFGLNHDAGWIAERFDIQGGVERRVALDKGGVQGRSVVHGTTEVGSVISYNRWLGHGYGNYPGQRPHNAFISLWAQAGIFAVPILATFLWHGRSYMRPGIVLPLVPALFFSDWLFSTAGGIATLAVYLWLAKEKGTRPQQEEEAVGDSADGRRPLNVAV